MDISKYQTANSWFSAMRGEGYEVPVILLQEIEKIMKKEKLSFQEAFERLESNGRITITDKIITFK